MPDNSMYWTPQKLLSYNRLFNIAIGSRGCGKSYGCKKLLIDKYIEEKTEFVYLRRSEVELETVKNSFFRDLVKNGLYSGHKLGVSGNEYMINDRVAGYALALSTAGKVKSNSFPNVKYILYDEFLIDKKGRQSYLRDETGLLVNLFETIDRARDQTRVLMMSNSMSVINPYFSKWNIKLSPGAQFQKVGSEIIVEIVQSEEFKAFKRNTRFGKFLSGTDEEKMIIENQFVSDNYSFVEKLNGKMFYQFGVVYNGVNIGVYYMPDHGVFYCNKKIQNSGIKFAFSTYDHKPNIIMFKTAKSNRMMCSMIQSFEYGGVRFESLEIKAAITEILGYI